MEAYKFDVTVQENGIIQIPEISKFVNREVEIFIMLKPEQALKIEKQQTLDQFLDKWRGALQGLDVDDLKAQYLQEKYG